MTSRLFDSLYLIALTILFFFLFHGAASSAPYGYDEADYMAGLRLGWRQNYLDTTAMSFPEFVDTGLKAARKQISRTELSDLVRARQDTLFLRHYHGPLNEYWLLFTSAVGGTGEQWMRLADYFFYILTFATIYLGVLWVWGAESRAAAVLASLCYLFCMNNVLSLTWLSSHVPYGWLSILTLLATAKFVSDPAPKRFYLALGLCVVSFCAIEYAGLLFIALAVALFLSRRKLFAAWASRDYWLFARNSLLLAIGLFLVLWPSSILKLTIVQGAAYTLYQVRRGGYAGSAGSTPWEVWRARFDEYPMDMALLCLGLAAIVLLVWRSPRRNQIAPLLVYAALLGLTTLKNTTDSARYVSTLFGPIYVAAAALIAPRFKRLPIAAQAGALAALGLTMTFVGQREAAAKTRPNPSDEMVALLAVMRAHPAATILVPFEDMPTLRYYYPQATVKVIAPGMTPPAIVAAALQSDGACADQSGFLDLRQAFPDSSPQPVGHLTCYFR